MSKFVQVLLLAVVVVLLASPAMAQAPAGVNPPAGQFGLSGAFGAGLVVIGAGYGIGCLASSAVEAMARQPEVAATIQVTMIIAAALIEGFTFYGLYICMTQNPWVAP
ncbi:MAG TPA: ATP synthase F0 subunit C [Pirellulales bacterium]|nr:ATP synthase F0 subunit C [Pirellulales bacterium]